MPVGERRQPLELPGGHAGGDRAGGAEDVAAAGGTVSEAGGRGRIDLLQALVLEEGHRVEVALQEEALAHPPFGVSQGDIPERRRVERVDSLSAGRFHQVQAIADPAAGVGIDGHAGLTYGLAEPAFVRQDKPLVHPA